MTEKISIAIIILAIVILILGAPFALNEYSLYQSHQTSKQTTITAVTTTSPPTLSTMTLYIQPNYQIFDTHWCRKEGSIKRCYEFFRNYSYSYGSDDTHSEVIMPDPWTLNSPNKYQIPDPSQTFSYLDGNLFTTLNPSFGPLVRDQYGQVRYRA